MALSYWLDGISQGPKNSQFPGPNPLPLALVMDMHASKTLCTGVYKSQVHKTAKITTFIEALAFGNDDTVEASWIFL